MNATPLQFDGEEPEKKPRGKKAETALAKPEPAAVTPLRLIEMAVAQGADIDRLSKLMDLQERWEKTEARKAFVQAMAAFKADIPQIVKNKSASFGQGKTAYEYASLDHICEILAPALSKYGLSHTWKVSQNGDRVRVTCIITHEMGHSEETTLEGPADNSGSKNAIQAIGSSTTYLEKYTFLAAVGTAAKGQDTDGHLNEPMPDEDQCLKAIADAPDTSALKKIYTEGAAKAYLAKNGPALIRLQEARSKRNKELTAEEPS